MCRHVPKVPYDSYAPGGNHDLVNRYGISVSNICVENDHGYIPFIRNHNPSFPRSWSITERYVNKQVLNVYILHIKFYLSYHIGEVMVSVFVASPLSTQH
jgi:hypothetical protein